MDVRFFMIAAGLASLTMWSLFSSKKYQQSKNASVNRFFSYAFLILGILIILYTIIRWKKM